MKYLSKSEDDTVRYAVKIAEKLGSGDILCLQGDLGSGKTVFARALIRHLCGDSGLDVPSPTFTLLQTYESAQTPIWHFDLYRLEDPEEIYELGWEDALNEALAIVEWPERLGNLAPPNRLTLRFETSKEDENQRTITATPYGNWKERI